MIPDQEWASRRAGRALERNSSPEARRRRAARVRESERPANGKTAEILAALIEAVAELRKAREAGTAPVGWQVGNQSPPEQGHFGTQLMRATEQEPMVAPMCPRGAAA